MTKKSLWYPSLGKGLLLGALLVLAVPGVAFANTMSVTVQTPGATSGLTSTFSEIETDADCSSGALISGGGVNQAIGTGSGVTVTVRYSEVSGEQTGRFP
jgi:hypothetical protein